VLRSPLTVQQSQSKNKCRPNEDQAIGVEAQIEPSISETVSEEIQRKCVNRRKVSNASNWEKIREAMLQARIDIEDFQEDTCCVVCVESLETIRCQYCGLKQYFCHVCAENIHANRNQFHVLEQWKVLREQL
jgi:hypothetical protein